MAKKKGKTDKKSKSKKTKKNKNDIAEIISKAIGTLARKSTKKLLKSFEKKPGNLVTNITPGNLLSTILENTVKKDKSGDSAAKQPKAAPTGDE